MGGLSNAKSVAVFTAQRLMGNEPNRLRSRSFRGIGYWLLDAGAVAGGAAGAGGAALGAVMFCTGAGAFGPKKSLTHTVASAITTANAIAAITR